MRYSQYPDRIPVVAFGDSIYVDYLVWSYW
jgi:hypothetical protein